MISEQTKEYFELGKRNDVRERAKRLRRQFLRYKDAEIVYSIHHPGQGYPQRHRGNNRWPVCKNS